MTKQMIAGLALLAFTLPLAAHADVQRVSAPEGAKVYIIHPADGAKVKSPVKVQFGLSGMGVAPAGQDIAKTGHHHLLIDTDYTALKLDEPFPATERVRHFGGGQTEVSVELAPGTHTLQLLLGDHRHIAFDPPVVSQKITIIVE